MKKLLLSIGLAAIMATPATIAQNLSVNGVEYKTFQEAFNAIGNEGTITVLQDFNATPAINAQTQKNENAALLVGNKNITIKGNGHNIGFKTFFVFNLMDVTGSLTVEDLTLTYIADNASNRGVINVGKGNIALNNVTIKNANIDSKYSVIGLNNSNSNIPSAVFNGVKLENCKTTAEAEVLLATNNLTLSGNCSFSLFVNNSVNDITPAAGENLTGSISLLFDNPALGQVAVRNCTDASIFTIKNEGFGLESDGTDIIINNKPSGIEDVVIDSNAPARYYNLSGIEVNENTLKAGVYIVVKGDKASKIQIR